MPSIFSQTFGDFEVIVVIDGPDGGTFESLRDFREPRLKVIQLKERSSLPKNPFDRWTVQGARPRNTAAQVASGKWLYWMSDDDVLLPHALETFAQAIRSNETYKSWTADFLLQTPGGWDLITPKNSGIPALSMEITGMPAWITHESLRSFRWNEHSYKSSWNKPSDYDLQVRLRQSGVKFGHISQTVAKIFYADEVNRLHGSAYHMQCSSEPNCQP